jgi:hypothetical protein
LDRRADFRARFPAIRRVLLDEWDPMSVRDDPDDQDAYDGYALAIYGLLARGATDEHLAEYLADAAAIWLESDAISQDTLLKVIRALRRIEISVRSSPQVELEPAVLGQHTIVPD